MVDLGMRKMGVLVVPEFLARKSVADDVQSALFIILSFRRVFAISTTEQKIPSRNMRLQKLTPEYETLPLKTLSTKEAYNFKLPTI